ncbi:MFS transporter [Saccharolobus islandicus]|uniref:MFS transporter n=1 Tax=Saccharolobus islandicus TaxID=43080 RepID=UPI00036BA0DA|nr:MFS transporter [Sulfolobus islandicus]
MSLGFTLGFPHGLTYPLSVISISRTFRVDERNTANSIFFAIMMIIGIVVPSVTGYIADIVGLRNMFGLLIPVVLVLMLFLSRYVKYVDEVVKNLLLRRFNSFFLC